MTDIKNPFYNYTVVNQLLDLDLENSNEIAVLSVSGSWILKIINIRRVMGDFLCGEFIRIEYD
jgi:hypothetical protein